MTDIDMPLIAFLTESVDMMSQTEEVQKGVEEAVGRAFAKLSRKVLTDDYIFPGDVTPRQVLEAASDIVTGIHTGTAEHKEYLHTVYLALKGALED
ncbi:hypothetical protein [Nocardia jiangxiensis]|uniref:hypothetical protein n=1 Tax=Nocardia jiangxiensis TaxID=282685 RepID=UPI000313DE49|nr:hypothetical protein [Nocardia jiangxiensis]